MNSTELNALLAAAARARALSLYRARRYASSAELRALRTGRGGAK